MEIYLDNSATTKCYECVRDIVGKVMCEDYGNPSSMHRKRSRGRTIYQGSKGNHCKGDESAGKRNSVYIRWYRIRQPCADWWCTCK